MFPIKGHWYIITLVLATLGSFLYLMDTVFHTVQSWNEKLCGDIFTGVKIFLAPRFEPMTFQPVVSLL